MKKKSAKYSVSYSNDGKELLKVDENYQGEFVVPEGVVSIGEEAFMGCEDLTSVVLPESVVFIRDRAFCDCFSLSSINLPSSLLEIGDNAFEFCYIETINLPESLTYIGTEAFKFGSLKEVVLPKSLTTISSGCFLACLYLKSVVMPESVLYIENGAFFGCKELTSIEIPCSVVSIAHTAFVGCDKLTSLKVDPDNSIYDSREDCNAIIETATNTLVTASGRTQIPQTVTRIGTYAFSNSRGTVFVPKQITSIATNAFDSSLLDELHFESDCPSEIEFGEDAIPANISVIVPPDTAPIYSFHKAFSHRGLRIEAEELPEPEWDWEAELKKMESEPKYIDWEVYEWEWEDDISEGDEMWGKLFLS